MAFFNKRGNWTTPFIIFLKKLGLKLGLNRRDSIVFVKIFFYLFFLIFLILIKMSVSYSCLRFIIFVPGPYGDNRAGNFAFLTSRDESMPSIVKVMIWEEMLKVCRQSFNLQCFYCIDINKRKNGIKHRRYRDRPLRAVQALFLLCCNYA